MPACISAWEPTLWATASGVPTSLCFQVRGRNVLPAERELLDLIVYKATRTSPKSSYVSRNLWLLLQMYDLSFFQ